MKTKKPKPLRKILTEKFAAEKVKAERKARFIRALTEFLVGNQAGKSIALEMETRSPRPAPLTAWAHEWAKLRGATPLFGYPTAEEAEQALTEFLK